MQINTCPIAGLKIVKLDVYADNRGFFTEQFQVEKFKNLGIGETFVQDNWSRSRPRVIRGLHIQHTPPQAKLVGVIRGRIWDVAIDLRRDSPTFGQHFGLELSDINGLRLFIPAGFAHGFCVLGDEEADVLYKVDSLYNPKGETCLLWNDPDLNIPFPINDPVVSERDLQGLSFKDFTSQFE